MEYESRVVNLAEERDVQLLDNEGRASLQKTIDGSEFTLIFVIDRDGNVKALVPEDTDPAELLEIPYDTRFNQTHPLREGLDSLVNLGTATWILARTPNPGHVCYWWAGGRCFCCGQH